MGNMGKFRRFAAIGMLLFLPGCYVNRAVIDPFGAAPDGSCTYWRPDCEATALKCEGEANCPDLPCEDYKLSLAEVLDIALVNSPQTAITWAEARQAAAEYALSQSTAFPTITFVHPYSHTRTAFLTSQVEQSQNITKEVLIINDQTTWGPRAKLAWTLLDFGQRRYTSYAARYALYYANFTHNQAIQTLVETTTLDYYQYLYQVKLLEANEANLADAEVTLDAAELGLRQGVKNVSDVLQARTQALLAEITLSEQRKAVNDTYATLLNTLGLPANATISLDKLPFIDPENANLPPLGEYLDQALQCRPDLLASRANVSSTEMSLKAAKRQWVPVVDYNLDIGRTYFGVGLHDNYDYTSIIEVSMPIFTGFHIRNSVRQARAKVEQADAELRQTELTVVEEVTTAHYNVGVAFTTLKAAIKYLKTAQEQYLVAISQYRAGVNTILDVVSAQSSLFDARAKQAEAVKQWFNTFATLTYATGLISSNIEDYPCE